MKDLFEVSFSILVKASPLAKGLTEPFAKIFEITLPRLERFVEAATKRYEDELKDKETPKDKT